MSGHKDRAHSSPDWTSLYQETTDKIIAELEAGRAPWVQSRGTATAKAPLAMPKSTPPARAVWRGALAGG